MKLTNVKYRYRRDLDRWLIIFPTHAEAKAFEWFYSDGKYKPQFCTYTKTATETTHYRAIYAQLTGRFEQLRKLYRAKCMRNTIVDDLESDGTFDKIELIFDTESGIASFRIEKLETWTDWDCKSILNTQYGVQKEIDEMTKRIYKKLDIKQVKDFDTDTAWHEYLTAFDGGIVCEYCKRDVDICKEMLSAIETAQTYGNFVEPIIFINHKACALAEFIEDSKDTNEKEANNKEEKNMGPKDTTFAEYCRRLYWGQIDVAKVKPTKILIRGTATIIWWSDGTKTVVKCQKGDKMDPEKGIAMCVMKKFMGTNKTGSNYLDFAKDAIAKYEEQQEAEKAKKKAEADKRRRAAAKKKGTAGNTNYKRGTKGEAETENKEES